MAAYLSLAFVVLYVADLTLLDVDPRRFNEVHRALGRPALRVVAVVFWFGVLFHALDGLRGTVEDLRPRSDRWDEVLRALVGFTTLAAGIPVAVVILWPWIGGWFS